MVFDRRNGIYRGFIAALVGLILVSAAPQNGRKESRKNSQTKAETSQSAPAVAPSATKPIKIVQRPINERPCDQGRDNRESDLCAQWKAADAASKAAWWAAVATFVTAIGTFGLFWQIKLTREAVQDTGEATKAMREANSIAREMGQRQIRAYLHAGKISIEPADQTGESSLYVIVANSGNTPAFLKRLLLVYAWMQPDGNEGKRELVSVDLAVSIPAGKEGHLGSSIKALLALIDVTKPQSLMVSGIVTYDDCFGVERKTVFSRSVNDGDFSADPLEIITAHTTKGDQIS